MIEVLIGMSLAFIIIITIWLYCSVKISGDISKEEQENDKHIK